MGGYGALLAAETRPREFAAVCGVSPAVWTSYEEMMMGPRDAFDGAADFAAHDVIAHADRLRHTRVRIDCGTSDPFYGYVTHLTAALPGTGRRLRRRWSHAGLLAERRARRGEVHRAGAGG